MKLLASLALLVATAVATPIARAPKEFTLQTSGASNSDHNDLYVYAYHTGAGFNDAVLSKDEGIASSFYLNGTYAVADLKTEFPWGVFIPGNTNYASWDQVGINAGTGTQGFSVKDGLFVWSEQLGFGGWLVCDWYHNAPQLFYLKRNYEATIPSTCSKVQLKTITAQ